MIGKLRKDARLRRLYQGPQKARGRKKQFDVGNINDTDFQQSTVTLIDEKKFELRHCIGYSESLKRTIKIVKVSKLGAPQEVIALLFSTDLELDAMKIYSCYTTRFQIEFVFRDAKNFTGFNDSQSRNKDRLNYHANASLAALNVVKMQDYEALREHNKPQSFSMASWGRKYSVEIIINRFLSMFDFDQTLIKSHPNFKTMLSFGEINYKNL